MLPNASDTMHYYYYTNICKFIGLPAYEVYQRLIFGSHQQSDEITALAVHTYPKPVCLLMQIKGFVEDVYQSLGGLDVIIQLSHDNRSALIHHQRSKPLEEKWIEADLPSGTYGINIIARGNSLTELRIYDFVLSAKACTQPSKFVFKHTHTSMCVQNKLKL